MTKPFASTTDVNKQPAELIELAPDVYGYISEFDPNTGVIVGDADCLAIDCRATPALASEMINDLRAVTELPVARIFLTHYHAVRVLGRAAFEQAHTVIASSKTRALIAERGAYDFESEVRRFPRLFDAVEQVPGLTWPNLTFPTRLTLHLGRHEVQLIHPGSGHTLGDSIVWLPEERVLFAGDLIENRAALYCGDAYLRAWRRTLDQLQSLDARIVVPGRGATINGADAVAKAIARTRGFIDDLLTHTQTALDNGASLKACFDHVYGYMTPTYGDWPIFEHCMPFNVSRAYDELSGIEHPRIWTAARDIEMWNKLQSS